MGGLFSALGSFWSLLVHIFDPLCGPVGIFTWLAPSTILACGDTGWGDEIALGLQVTVSVAIVTLPIGLVIGMRPNRDPRKTQHHDGAMNPRP